MLRAKFTDALDADLNTSLAITALYDVLKYDTTDRTKAALLREFDEVLSLDLFGGHAAAAGGSDPDAEKIEALIAERAAAKAEKNYARADEIRGILADMGVVLKDTKEGTTWERA